MERDLAVLGRLRDLGMAIAEALGRQVEAAPAAAAPDAAEDPAPPPAPLFTGDLVLGFARLARAVRVTVALRARLIGELEAVDELQDRRTGHRRDAAREDRKAQLGRVLTRIIEDETLAACDDDSEGGAAETDAVEGREGDSEACERLIDEAYERLDDEERYGDLLDRPVSELIALICRDLGLSPDWPRLAEEAWAQDELRSGRVGTPLADAAAGPRGQDPRPERAAAFARRAALRRRRPETAAPPPAPDYYWPGVDPPRV